MIQFWDHAEGHLIHEVHIARDSWAVHFSPDGSVAGIIDGDLIRLFDARPGGPLGEPLVRPARVTAFAFSPGGRRLLAGLDDGTLR